MALWVLRGGRQGERERFALDHGLALIGWERFPDMSHIASRQELTRTIERERPTLRPRAVSAYCGHLWSFVHDVKVGDLLLMPLKGKAVVAVGEVTGPYQYHPELPPSAQHARDARWLREDLLRAAIPKDIRDSVENTPASLFAPRAERAEARIRAVM
jgi:restriction system protein